MLSASSYDPYIRAIRWATDRLGNHGVVCYVTNGGFLDGIASDGIRKCLLEEYDAVYVIDLGGNIIKNPTLSGTTHNVFGIQVDVAITVLIKRETQENKGRAQLAAHRLPWNWKNCNDSTL